jgi:hypothetical protein
LLASEETQPQPDEQGFALIRPSHHQRAQRRVFLDRHFALDPVADAAGQRHILETSASPARQRLPMVEIQLCALVDAQGSATVLADLRPALEFCVNLIDSGDFYRSPKFGATAEG